MKYLHILCHSKSLRSRVYFTLRTHLSLDTDFSPKIHDLCLEFIKCTDEKVDLHTQSVPNMVKSFLITGLGILLNFKLITI